MQPESSALGTGYRALLVALSVAVLTSCAAAPAPQPQRTYDRIRGDQIYPMTQGVFAAAGYKTEPCHEATICVETNWKENDGEKRGAATLRERRMYQARYSRDPIDDRFMLFLGVHVQERSPGGTDWTDKQIDFGKDAEYLQILQGIDRAVKQLGGVQY